jgi:uncharacterized protein YhfF
MPVTDVDRARRLSTSLGWREDADVASSGEVRIAPGDLRGVGYVVADVEAVDHRVDPQRSSCSRRPPSRRPARGSCRARRPEAHTDPGRGLRRTGQAGCVSRAGLGNLTGRVGRRRIIAPVDVPERVCEFGFPGPLRDRLVAAVLRGEKTATSALMVEWEEEGEALPQVGDCETVVDSDGRPVAVIELVAVKVIRLGDAELRLALDEGEGFHSVAEWRDDHERFWNDEVRPELRDGAALQLDDDTQVVAQWFRLVERLPAHG